MDQVANVGVLMKMETKYLEQGLKMKLRVLHKVSAKIETSFIHVI